MSDVPAMYEDWLDPADRIIARLRAAVPELRGVDPINEISALRSPGAVGPRAFVMYDGDRFERPMSSGGCDAGAQRWVVILTVKSAKGAGDGRGLPKEAGPLLIKVRQALRGWSPYCDGVALRQVTPARPGYSSEWAYYASAFELPFVDG